MYEDGWGEWATFYSFALSGALASAGLLMQYRTQNRKRTSHLILLVLAVFCWFVAGEEISWGQRILGTMSPDVFQKLNYQQETNLHNVLSYFISPRVVIGLICLGYGVMFPIAATKTEKRSEDLSPPSFPKLVPPSLWLAPWFAVTGIAYWIQPFMMSLEALELLFGLILFADIILRCRVIPDDKGGLFQFCCALALLSVPFCLAAVTNPLLDRLIFTVDENEVAKAKRELDSIGWDLQHAGAIYPEVARHNRVYDSRIYSSVRNDIIRFTSDSRFLSKTTTQAELKRKQYFLDPWNSPYWICMKGKGRVHLYSFGPNRRLETLVLTEERVPNEADLAGDDIGIWVDLYGTEGRH